MRTVCERPGCEFPVRHRPHVGGEPVAGWEELCCIHVDDYMRTCAATVPMDEARAGWEAWTRAHDAMCGPEGDA